ncbi:hypothetical protein ACTXT7_016858 [Hymenolepis weldensis]
MSPHDSLSKSTTRNSVGGPGDNEKSNQTESAVCKQPVPTIHTPVEDNQQKQDFRKNLRRTAIDIINKHLGVKVDKEDQTNRANSSQELSASPVGHANNNNNQVLQHHRNPGKKQNKACSGITGSRSNKYDQSTTSNNHNSKPGEQDNFWSNRRNFGKQFNHRRGWNDRERKDPCDKQKSESRQGQNRKSKPEELHTYLNEEEKKQENSFHKVQSTPTPSQPKRVTTVHAESAPLHASKKPPPPMQSLNNAQSPTSALIDSEFPVVYPLVPNFPRNTVVVLSDEMPTFIAALPNITIFSPGSRAYLSDPQNYVHYATGITLPDVPITVPFQCCETSINIPNQSQSLAGNNPQPTNLGTAKSTPVHTSKGPSQPMEHTQPSPQVIINSGFPGAVPTVLNFAPGSVIVVSNEQAIFIPARPNVTVFLSKSWIYLT